MTFVDIWLLLSLGTVFLTVAEYVMILGMSIMNKVTTYKEKKDLARKIDFWAMTIFIRLYVMVVGTYFYCIYVYAYACESNNPSALVQNGSKTRNLPPSKWPHRRYLVIRYPASQHRVSRQSVPFIQPEQQMD